MKIAVISDIHSNLEALTRVLASIELNEVKTIYCLGDLVGYGAYPNECIDLVRKKCAVVVQGNHDAGSLSALPLEHFNEFGRVAIRWTQKTLTAENLEYLHTLDASTTVSGITLAHASPHEPSSWQYVLSWRDAERSFKAFASKVCFIGHTHVPMVVGEDKKFDNLRAGVKHLVNVRSVGQPRDGNPRASYGLFDTRTWEYRNVRVDYDVDRAAQAILKERLPDFLAQRLYLGI
jgi:diadenosine tetraphosphatase ApaH/serine/threonine PP2A family protein phosphatase